MDGIHGSIDQPRSPHGKAIGEETKRELVYPGGGKGSVRIEIVVAQKVVLRDEVVDRVRTRLKSKD